jgi:hypothetical protein
MLSALNEMNEEGKKGKQSVQEWGGKNFTTLILSFIKFRNGLIMTARSLQLKQFFPGFPFSLPLEAFYCFVRLSRKVQCDPEKGGKSVGGI